MNTNLKKFALAAITVCGLSFAALGFASAPAEARVLCDRDGDDCAQVPGWYERRDSVVCDEDGDDCARVPGWYGRGGDDWDWRRHEWEEQREREAYRNWPDYRDYYYNRPAARGDVWFGF